MKKKKNVCANFAIIHFNTRDERTILSEIFQKFLPHMQDSIPTVGVRKIVRYTDDFKMPCFSRANHASTNLKKVLS